MRLAAWCLAILLLNAGSAAALAEEAAARDRRIPPVVTEWQSDKNHEFRYRTTAGTKCRVVSKNRLELEDGELLLETTNSTVVTSPVAETFIKGGSAVLLRQSKGALRCMVIWDNGRGSCHVVCHKHRAKLGPGDEALVSVAEPTYREIMGDDEVGRRRVKLHTLRGGNTVVTCEFSLLQAMERIPLLYEVFHSPDRRDRVLREKIIKMAAVLDWVTRRHGYYSTGSRF